MDQNKIQQKIFDRLPLLVKLPIGKRLAMGLDENLIAQSVDINSFMIFTEYFLHYYNMTQVQLLSYTQQFQHMKQPIRESKIRVADFIRVFQFYISQNPKTESLNLILRCLMILFQLNPKQFLQEYGSSRITAILMKELSDKEIPILTYISIIKFFMTFCQGAQSLNSSYNLSNTHDTQYGLISEKAVEHLTKNQLITEVCGLAILKTVNEHHYYKENKRSVYHSYWCWAVALVRSYIGALSENASRGGKRRRGGHHAV